MTGKALDILRTATVLAATLVCGPKSASPGELTAGATAKPKGIKERFVPPVAGIDLEQALNFTDAEGIDLTWFYNSFTYPRVFYKSGHGWCNEHARPPSATAGIAGKISRVPAFGLAKSTARKTLGRLAGGQEITLDNAPTTAENPDT